MFLEVKEVAREKGQRLQEESKLPRHSSQIPAALIGQISNMVSWLKGSLGNVWFQLI